MPWSMEGERDRGEQRKIASSMVSFFLFGVFSFLFTAHWCILFFSALVYTQEANRLSTTVDVED